MSPTRELTEEHEQLLKLGWDIAEAQRQGSDVDPLRFEEFVGLHERHSRKEELGLFPLVLEAGDCLPEQISRFEREHREQTEELASGHFDRDAYYALAAHAQAEEDEVFPMAMFGFDNIMWADMESAHRSVDDGSHLSWGPGNNRWR